MRIEDLGLASLINTPSEFASIIKAETPYWAKVVKDARVQKID